MPAADGIVMQLLQSHLHEYDILVIKIDGRMQVIDLTSCAENPDFSLEEFCVANYRQCVVSVVWRQIESSHELLYASMELVPIFIADDFDAINQSKKITRKISSPETPLGTSEERTILHYQRLVKPVRDAFMLFECAKAKARLPLDITDDGQEKHILVGFAGVGSQAPCFNYSPGELETAYEYGVPFATNLYYDAQVCHLWPDKSSDELLGYISDENVDKWISDRIYWHLYEFEEYIQSVNLILPNPYYSKSIVENDLSNSRGAPSCSRLHFDRDCSKSQLKLTAFESVNDAHTLVKTSQIKGTTVEIRRNSILSKLGYVVTDRHDRIVEISPEASCLLGINISMGIENHRVRFMTKDHKVEQELSVMSHEEVVCENRKLSIPNKALHDRLVRIKYQREQKKAADGQVIYNKDQVRARCDIRTIVNSAKTSILIIDPYFDALAAQMYLPASNTGVSIHIIRNYGSLFDKGKRLKDEFIELSHAMSAKYSDCKIDIAKDKKMHDRFIVVDDRSAWMLGSSMQSLGNSLSAIVKFKDPETVIKILKKYVSDIKARPLQEVISESQQRQRCVCISLLAWMTKSLASVWDKLRQHT